MPSTVDTAATTPTTTATATATAKAMATRRLHPAATADPAPLDPISLGAVAHGYAQGLLRHELSELAPPAGERQYELVLRTEACEVWVIAWGAGSRLPLHDHGESAGAFELVQGELFEVHTGIDADAALVANRLVAGSRRTLAPGDVHEVHNPSVEIAVSVHAYSPPLTELGFYDLTRTYTAPSR